jgi:uncharacterized protein YegP (UPF0339 family)
VKKYKIWIVRSAGGRYRWVFTASGDGAFRVLAQSPRTYSSRRKVKRAIRAVRDHFPDAEVSGPGDAPGPFELPNTSFAVDFDVVPLIVDSPKDRARRANEQTQIASR